MQLTVGYVVAERFRLVRELGRGGMGSVWLAEHTQLDTQCAIKFIDKQGQNSPEMRSRFEREAKAAAQLKSPHVVQVLDHGEWEGVPYIAMEYLEGEDLAHRLDRLTRLSPADTHRIVSQVARALTKAHTAGIVHRDLKPENIFLVKDDDLEIAKVLDFGIAKRVRAAIDDNSTRSGSLLGTPFYMSPEQARGTRDVDHRSDLWALGVIAFQCLTGQVPFSSEGLGDILAQIMFEDLPVPSKRATGIPPGFDAWWTRACARPVEDRFQSARDLAEALGVALAISMSADRGVSYAQIDPPVSADQPVRSAPTSKPKLELAATHSVDPDPALIAAATPSATTDNPLSVTYQREGEQLAARSPRKGLIGAAVGGALALAALGFFARGRADHAPAAAAAPERTLTAQPPTVAVVPSEPAPQPEAMPSPAPAASTAAAKTSSTRATSPATSRGAVSHTPKSGPAPASGHKKMDFGI